MRESPIEGMEEPLSRRGTEVSAKIRREEAPSGAMECREPHSSEENRIPRISNLEYESRKDQNGAKYSRGSCAVTNDRRFPKPSLVVRIPTDTRTAAPLREGPSSRYWETPQTSTREIRQLWDPQIDAVLNSLRNATLLTRGGRGVKPVSEKEGIAKEGISETIVT